MNSEYQTPHPDSHVWNNDFLCIAERQGIYLHNIILLTQSLGYMAANIINKIQKSIK